jgi:hypothetical protein
MFSLKPIASVLLILTTHFVNAQINAIFNYKIGTEIHHEHYNKKGKLQYRSIHKILRCDTTAKGLLYVINVKAYSPAGQELSNVDDSIPSVNGSLLVRMKSFYQMKDDVFYKFSTESEYLEIPGAMNDGQKLPDAKVVHTVIKQPRVKFSPGGGPLKSDLGAKVTYSITNRIVTNDKVATPAGKISAYKVTSNVTIESEVAYGYKIEYITHTWYATGAGMVKAELLNKRGKLLSYSIMAKRIQ